MFSIMSISANASDRCKQPAKAFTMSIDKALQNQSLIIAMHQQLDPGFLNNFQLVYTQNIVYKNLVIQISGTRLQWQMFFWPSGTKAHRHTRIRNLN
jgi:hypothetical protein